MPSRSRNRAARCSRTASASLPRGRSSQISAAVAAALASVAAPRAPALDAAAAVAAGASGGGALQEVVVTARKREENLQDVPISLDVFTKKDLQNLNIVAFEDYAQKDPSISFVSTGPGTQVFVMRGASDGSNPNYPNTSATARRAPPTARSP
jgi:iron complex outermembrane receptor protein